jgi:isochorismate synthase
VSGSSVAVRAERLGGSFDLLAAFTPGGSYMEHAGAGVAAGAGMSAPRMMTIGGPQAGTPIGMLDDLFSGLDTSGLSPDAPAPIVFGSVPFDPAMPGRFVLPARTVRRDRSGETWLLSTGGSDDDGDGLPARPVGAGTPSAPFSEMQVFPEPSPDAYERAVATAVAAIRAGGLRKVVLARTIRVEADRALDARPLLHHLRAVEPDGYVFAVEVGDGRTLVGASPELLVRRVGREIWANPLAGSATRAGDPAEDREHATRLGSSVKDRQEHAIVVEDVLRILHPLCVELHHDADPQLVPTANVWHLSTRFRGVLRDPNVTSLDLVRALHPTPAVCGAPRDIAMPLIRKLESVPRDGYAGAVGWMDATGDGVWALALRCAELHGSTARLFAGAGIVADSDPAAELDETERKFGAFLDSLRWG